MKDKVNGHNFQELISDYARNDDDRAWFLPIYGHDTFSEHLVGRNTVYSKSIG